MYDMGNRRFVGLKLCYNFSEATSGQYKLEICISISPALGHLFTVFFRHKEKE